MKTIDTAKLADVTGGAQQAPRPVAPPEPSPTVPPPPSSIVEGLRNVGQTGGATRSGTWFGWGHKSAADAN
jgi:hypothetical protein